MRGLKRRKLRKRKRRPSKNVLTGDPANFFKSDVHNRRPSSLDEVEQIWDVTEFESIHKPYSRRRLVPDYYPNDEPARVETTTEMPEEMRIPHKTKIDAEESGAAPDLKSVLKKSEGTLSLSEILQQKNLTLSDLLKGGSSAITVITQATDVKSNKRKQETVETQINIQEETFEASSEPDVAQKPNKTTKREDLAYNKKLKAKLPITSAKLFKYHRKHSQSTEKNLVDIDNTKLPPKAVQINVNDIFGFSQALLKNNPENAPKESDGPLKMVIDLDKLTNFDNEKSNTASTPSQTAKTDVKSTSETPTTKYVQAKLKTKSAKEEILDFITDKVNKENISQILESRNMTLEELIQLRERGSSQRHLLDIFRNKTDVDALKDEPYNEKVTNFFQTTSIVPGRRPKSHNLDAKKEQQSEYSVTSFPVYKIETKNLSQDKMQAPFWKSVYPKTDDTLGDQTESVERLEDIDNTIHSFTNGKLNVEIKENLDDNYDEAEEFFNWPPGVKSALFASLVIIGASLMIFLSILVLFKFSQKTKRKLCYRKTFSDTKIKTPILNDQPKRAIRTVLCDTFGRKNHNYWKAKQSMSDTIWDNNNRIPFQ